MRNATASEQSVTDGTRHLGHLVPKASAFECFDAAGTYLCKTATVAEARRAILTAHRSKAAAAAAVRSLPDGQLRAEREALRDECEGDVGVAPAGLMLSLYDAEMGRRGLKR